jgi:ubiquinone/menaquinone biosynthesis C-methylase UbiE
LLQGDITRLPLGDSTVDGVAAFHSLIHVPADQHRRVLEEVARVLRPGGRILVSEGAGQWDGRNPDWLDTGVEMQWYIAGAPTTRRQLRSVGFTIGNEQSVSNEDESWVFFDAVLGE